MAVCLEARNATSKQPSCSRITAICCDVCLVLAKVQEQKNPPDGRNKKEVKPDCYGSKVFGNLKD